MSIFSLRIFVSALLLVLSILNIIHDVRQADKSKKKKLSKLTWAVIFVTIISIAGTFILTEIEDQENARLLEEHRRRITDEVIRDVSRNLQETSERILDSLSTSTTATVSKLQEQTIRFSKAVQSTFDSSKRIISEQTRLTIETLKQGTYEILASLKAQLDRTNFALSEVSGLALEIELPNLRKLPEDFFRKRRALGRKYDLSGDARRRSEHIKLQTKFLKDLLLPDVSGEHFQSTNHPGASLNFVLSEAPYLSLSIGVFLGQEDWQPLARLYSTDTSITLPFGSTIDYTDPFKPSGGVHINAFVTDRRSLEIEEWIFSGVQDTTHAHRDTTKFEIISPIEIQAGPTPKLLSTISASVPPEIFAKLSRRPVKGASILHATRNPRWNFYYRAGPFRKEISAKGLAEYLRSLNFTGLVLKIRTSDHPWFEIKSNVKLDLENPQAFFDISIRGMTKNDTHE